MKDRFLFYDTFSLLFVKLKELVCEMMILIQNFQTRQGNRERKLNTNFISMHVVLH